MREDAATFGGAGFLPRTSSHDDELGQPGIWRACGVSCEYGRLRTVLLAEPAGHEHFGGDADARLMLALPNPQRLRAQFEGLRAAFEGAGVEVLVLRDDLERAPNLLFQRDLFAMLRDGAVLARPASRQRAGEECTVARCLAGARVPVIAMMTGTACLEGADVLWLDAETLLVGVGTRTNAEAVRSLSRICRGMDVRVEAVELPSGTQHLLGVVNRVDRDLAVVDRDRAPRRLLQLLERAGVATIAVAPDAELRERRGGNFVALGDRRVLMPSGCPDIRRRLEAESVSVFEVEIGEYIKAGGGVACATGIVHRDVDPAVSRSREW